MDYEALIKTLESEAESYAELLKVEKDKTDILIKGDIERLDKLMNAEQALNMRVNGIEKKRINIMNELGMRDKTLKDVIADAKNDELKTRGRLFKIYKDLKECTDELKSINEYNSMLIKARLNVITDLTDFMMSGSPEKKIKNGKIEKHNTYDKNANVMPQTTKSGDSTIKKRI